MGQRHFTPFLKIFFKKMPKMLTFSLFRADKYIGGFLGGEKCKQKGCLSIALQITIYNIEEEQYG